MRKQAQWNWDRRLTLVRLRAALLAPIVSSALEINKRAADRRNGRCGCDRSRSRPAIDPQQDEKDVEADASLSEPSHRPPADVISSAFRDTASRPRSIWPHHYASTI